VRGRGVRPCAAAAVCVFAGIAAPVASGHTGELNTVLRAGPYQLVVRALPVAAGAHTALAFRAAVAGRGTGAPVATALVSVLVHAPGGALSGPYRASGAGGSYYLLIPIPDASRWRDLRFDVAIAGPAGDVTARYVPPNLFDQWLYEPWVLLAAFVAAVLFLRGFVRLRRRGRRDHAPWWRLGLFSAGLAAIVLPLVSPLDVIGDHFLLSAHMLQHVLLGDVAPALLLLALRGPLLLFVVPATLLRSVAGVTPFRNAARWLITPRVALTAWAVAYGAWHVPAAYDLATRNQTVHDFEHASFLVAGLLVWALLVDPARRGRLSRVQRIRVAAVVFALGTVISDTLIFSPHPLYPAYAGQVERVLSLSPLRDQRLAGLVMEVDQLLTLGLCMAVLLWPMLRERRSSAPLRRLEQPA